MFTLKFKKFNFQGFISFILELVDKQDMIQIRFFPEHKELFDETQLRHIAPNRDINNPGGFVWAWIQKQDKVRKVTFDLFSEDRKLQITMTINLNQRTFTLDKADGISSIQVEEIIRRHFNSESPLNNKFSSVFAVLKLVWNNKIVSGVIIGLIVVYLAYLFGWNR